MIKSRHRIIFFLLYKQHDWQEQVEQVRKKKMGTRDVEEELGGQTTEPDHPLLLLTHSHLCSAYGILQTHIYTLYKEHTFGMSYRMWVISC